MKRITLIVIAFSTLISCKDKSYTYTGTLYKNCSKEPAANVELYLFQKEGTSISNSGGEIASFTTNENGEFAVIFEDTNGASIDMITSGSNPLIAGSTVMYQISPRNLDLGELYINNRATIDFYLDVKNPYTSSDTLIVIGKEFMGPFTDGVIHTLENFPWIPYYYGDRIAEGKKTGILWGINPNSTGHWNEEKIVPTGCASRDEIRITIE